MINLKLENIEQLRKAYDAKTINTALRRATSAARNKTRSEISRAVRDKYNVKARAINKSVKVSKRTAKNRDETLQYLLIYTGYVLPERHFSTMRPVPVSTRLGRRYGVRSKIYKGGPSSLSRRGFVVPLSNGTKIIAWRLGAKKRAASRSTPGRTEERQFIYEKFVKSIPQMVDDPRVFARARNVMSETYHKEFERQMNMLLEKAGYK